MIIETNMRGVNELYFKWAASDQDHINRIISHISFTILNKFDEN